MVFTKLIGMGLKLKPRKYKFFKREIVYLDHVVSQDRVQMDEHKIKAMRRWPVSHIIMEVSTFLGFANYYCQFLKGYALVTHPLYELVLEGNVSKKNRPVQWTDQCQEAFDRIKTSAALPPSWLSQISSSLLFSTPTPVGLAWVQSSIRPLMEKNV